MTRHKTMAVIVGLWLMVPEICLEASRKGTVEVDLVSDMTYRNLGPFRAGAWISDIAVPEQSGEEKRYTFYVAARNGGVWKTVNNGTTFVPIFDRYGVNAIGAVEVAPSDANIVWVGTGDNANARSSYAGNGVYRSLNGGKSFENRGLTDSHHIARIKIHPLDPDTVYVAAMGHLFSKNEERGVFKTEDGGRTWAKVLYIGPGVGVVDLSVNPRRPDTLFAATYDKHRYPWHFEAGGPGSRIYRSRDGGRSWQVLGGGLPGGNLGRIGVDVHRADPNIVYAVIQNLNPKPGAAPVSGDKFDAFTDHSYDDLIGGEVYRSDDGGDTWRRVSQKGVDVSGKAAYSFNEITVDPRNPEHVYITGVSMQYSHDGGRSWPRYPETERFLMNFGDVRTFWIDPRDPRHMMLGSDGGLYVSYDGGLTTWHLYQIPLGEVYHVAVDRSEPYHIYAGLQDHETWKGPVNGWSGSVGIEDWVITGMWDGMYTAVNPENNRWLYFTTQFGKHHRVDQLMGTRSEITPKAPAGRPPYRYTWTTPVVLSPHNGDIVYTGGQMLLRSFNRGRSWEEISPDLTTDDPEKIAGKGHVMFCTITTICESPCRPGTIWVGTDDGRVHLTRNHGADWRDLTPMLVSAGAPAHTWVARVVASYHDEATAYVCKSGYREDRFEPWVFRTRDHGQTWENISSDLPRAPVSVLFEDRIQPDLLFVGCDRGVFFTLNGGRSWLSLRNNMPPVPIRDLLVHPGTQDLVVGTYGRGVWITNITPLQELTEKVLDMEFFLFRILDRPVDNRSQRESWGNYHMTGDAHLRTVNEIPGLQIYHYQRNRRRRPLILTVENDRGQVMDRIELSNRRGISRTVWNSPERQPGAYLFVLRDGRRSDRRRGVLTEAPAWPLGDPDRLR